MEEQTMNIAEQMKFSLDSAIAAAMGDYQLGRLSFSDFQYNSKLTLEKMMKLMLTMRGGSINSELYDAGLDVTKSAFTKRRNLMPPELFENTLKHFNELCADNRTFRGYRVYAIDGTAVNMPRNPESPTFMRHGGAPKGYNQFHVTPLYDVLNKTYFDAVIQPQPRMDEIGALTFLLAWHIFPDRTLIVADRGFEAYHVFAWFKERSNADFLIRVRDGRNAMKPIAELPMEELDIDISFVITTTQTKNDKEMGYILVQNRKNGKQSEQRTYGPKWCFPSPYHMTLRVLRFQLDSGEYETLVTSLPRDFALSEIKELYHARWWRKYGQDRLVLFGAYFFNKKFVDKRPKKNKF